MEEEKVDIKNWQELIKPTKLNVKAGRDSRNILALSTAT